MRFVSRRDTLRRAIGLGAYCVCCGNAYAQQIDGCLIEDPHSFVNKNMSVFAFAKENVVRRSGVANLDADLSHALETIRASFSVSPGFAFYDDGLISNSGASKVSLFEGSKGTVLFGLNLLKDLLSRKQGDAAVVAVCAHEFAHIVAYDTDLYSQLVPDQTKPFRGEQHADYLAGFFAGQRKLIHSNYPAIVFLRTLRSLAGGGHGSEDQRAEAVWEGFQAAHDKKMVFEDGIQSGFEWAMKRPEQSNG